MKIVEKITELHRIITNIPESGRDYITIETPIDYNIDKRYIVGGKWNLLHCNANADITGIDAIKVIPWLDSEFWPVGYTMPYMESTTQYPSFKSGIILSCTGMLNKARE